MCRKNSDNITCKLYYAESAAQNRALMSRGVATRSLAFEKPDYSSIPSDAKEVTEMTGTTLLRNANYKITSDYNGTFKFDGYDGDIATRVYVDAQWTIPATFQFQNGIEIIVMNNAKINASGTMTFIRNSMLTIMEKGRSKRRRCIIHQWSACCIKKLGDTGCDKHHDSTFRCNTLQQRNHNQQEYLNQFQYENCK